MTDPTKDYAVSAVDPYESSLQPLVASSNAPFSTSLPPAHPGQGLMEGKGMLSWNLAEKREGTTWVCGKVMQDLSQGRAGKRRKVEEDDEEADYDAEEGEGDTEDEGEGTHETLEVWLQLVEVSTRESVMTSDTDRIDCSDPPSPRLSSLLPYDPLPTPPRRPTRTLNHQTDPLLPPPPSLSVVARPSPAHLSLNQSPSLYSLKLAIPSRRSDLETPWTDDSPVLPSLLPHPLPISLPHQHHLRSYPRPYSHYSTTQRSRTSRDLRSSRWSCR